MCAEQILERLKALSATELCQMELDAMKWDIASKLKKGWLADEIVAHMRNMEAINPDIDEGLALAIMRRVTNEVNARLSTGSVQQLKGLYD